MDERIITIAKYCHELNRMYCEKNGDTSQKTWDEAEEWQRESAIKGVEFRLTNPNAPISAQHDNWTKDKLADGWVYGEEKDSEKKTHPCLVDFDKLPEFQQKKDKLFCNVVDTLNGAPFDWEAPSNKDELIKFYEEKGYLIEDLFKFTEDKEEIEKAKTTLSIKYDAMAKTLTFLYHFLSLDNEEKNPFSFRSFVYPALVRLRPFNNQLWEDVDVITKPIREYSEEGSEEKKYYPLRTDFNPFDFIQFYTKYSQKLWKAIEVVEIVENKEIDKLNDFVNIIVSLFALLLNGVNDTDERIAHVWQIPYFSNNEVKEEQE